MNFTGSLVCRPVRHARRISPEVLPESFKFNFSGAFQFYGGGHNEGAPNQFEYAPVYGEANLSADQNLMILIKKIAKKHRLKVIFHEKPFAGVNGSGKHCNWSFYGRDARSGALSKFSSICFTGAGRRFFVRFSRTNYVQDCFYNNFTPCTVPDE